ncbi:MAG: tetratricopeptide repeat protein [Myxococcales bacterium]|nr:tetratricopeptide repeat protein [Myxococcales bacterium]
MAEDTTERTQADAAPTRADGPRRRDGQTDRESAATPAPASARDLPLPARLGRYLVIERIGAGGMGVVVAAYDPELERKLAIKLIRADRAGSDARARLLREAQAMARLSHPNVVPVFDVGLVDDQVFVAMEFVRGQTLTKWLKAAPRPWREVLPLFIAVGRGLAAAHEAGMVHRDLKPDNVLVADNGRVQVTDFGLARTADDAPERLDVDPARASGLAEDLTQTGTILGTPAYMAPEQFMGLAIDARTDQFAFCVSLYQGLAGQMPFRGSNVEALGAAICTGRLHDPRALRVPAWLRKVVLRGLRTDPAERWPDMPALLAALTRDPRRARLRWLGLAGAAAAGMIVWRTTTTPATSCSAAADELAGVWDDGRRAAVEAALRSTGLVYADATWSRVQAGLDAYAGAWSAMNVALCESGQPELRTLQAGCLAVRRRELQAVVDVLAAADAGVGERAAQMVSALPGLAGCADALALRSGVPAPAGAAADVAALRDALAGARAEAAAGRYAAALTGADAALAAAEPLAYRPLIGEIQLLRGRAHESLGDYTAAAVDLEAAWRAALASGDDALAIEAAAGAITVVGRYLARTETGFMWAGKAEAMLERHGRDDLPSARVLYNLGNLYERTGRYADAVAALERATELRSRALGPEHLEVAAAQVALANALMGQGQLAACEAALTRALAIQEAALGPEHPVVATARNNLGNALESAGRYAEAEAQLARVVAIRERVLGPDHPEVAASRTNLGVVLLMQGRFTEAEDQLRRAVAVRERAQGPEHPDLAAPIADLGNLYFASERPAEAEALYRRALAIDLAALGADHPDVALTRSNLGAALWRLGRLDEARAELDVAAAAMARALGERHTDRAAPLHTLGEVALARGQAREAVALLEQAEALAAPVWPPANLARVRFALARARWHADLDRPAARELAAATLEPLRAGGPLFAPDLARAEAWLRDHAA